MLKRRLVALMLASAGILHAAPAVSFHAKLEDYYEEYGFDLPGFHDQILREGALPLAVLDAHIRDWVAAGGK